MIFKRKEGLHLILSDTLSAHLPEEPTAVALGFFDGIHRGHTKVISAAVQAARQQGLTPCVFTFSPPLSGENCLPERLSIIPTGQNEWDLQQYCQ